MALYLGANNVKINLGSTATHLQCPLPSPSVDDIILISSDGYILKDVDGILLTGIIPTLSSDGYMLKDSNNLFLTVNY